MPLEDATRISELVATNPLGSDPIGQGDDHVRLIKQVLKNEEAFKDTQYATLADWQNDTKATVGVVTWAERTAGFGGGATGDVIAGIDTVDGFSRPQHGSLDLTWVLREPSGGVTPENVGAFGDGINDDLAACQHAVDTFDVVVRKPGSIYNLNGGTLDIPDNFSFVWDHSARFKNGIVDASHANADNINLSDLFVEDGTLSFGGTLFPINHATNCTAGNLRCLNATPSLGFHTGTIIESITAEWGDDLGVPRVAMNIACMYECNIGSIHLSGFYTMGFQTTGNGSTDDVFATFNTTIGSLVSIRNKLSAGQPGWHGFYLLGNVNLNIKSIYSIGYIDETDTVSVAVKLRDSWDCTIDSIVCDRMVIASDGNTGLPLVNIRNNKIGRIDMISDPLDLAIVGPLFITEGAGAERGFENNRINWFRGILTTSGVITELGALGGVIFTGYFELLSTGDFQNAGVKFDGADFYWAFSSGNFIIRTLNAVNSRFNADITTNNTDINVSHCTFTGLLRGDSSAGTFSSVVTNCVIGGALTVNNFGGRIWDADWSNTDVHDVQPNPAFSLPNGVVRFRNVSFDDRVYHTSLTDFTDLPVP